MFLFFPLLSTQQWNNLCLKCCRLAVGGGGCSQLFDSLIRYCGASNNNTNNAIVFGHYGLEWPKVDAPAALEGHSRPECPKTIALLVLLLLAPQYLKKLSKT